MSDANVSGTSGGKAGATSQQSQGSQLNDLLGLCVSPWEDTVQQGCARLHAN